MQFRCYTCGFVMHNGIPPLEALTQQQYGMVGATDEPNVDRFALLEGTPFSGMSTYQFCAFCLHAITEYMSVFMEDVSHRTEWKQSHYRDPGDWHALFCPDCNKEIFHFDLGEDGEDHYPYNLHYMMNRLSIMHRVEMLYRNADLSTLKSLLNLEV